MKQQTLAVAADENAQYEQYRKPTRRDLFLVTIDGIVPWEALCSVVEPHYGESDWLRSRCRKAAGLLPISRRGAIRYQRRIGPFPAGQDATGGLFPDVHHGHRRAVLAYQLNDLALLAHAG